MRRPEARAESPLRDSSYHLSAPSDPESAPSESSSDSSSPPTHEPATRPRPNRPALASDEPVTDEQVDAVWNIIHAAMRGERPPKRPPKKRRRLRLELLADDLNALLAVARSRHRGEFLSDVTVLRSRDVDADRVRSRIAGWRHRGSREAIRH